MFSMIRTSNITYIFLYASGILMLGNHLMEVNASDEFPQTTNADDSSTNASYAETVAMLKTLLSGYDTRIRPRYWQAEAVLVMTTFVPVAVVDLDIAEQTMTVRGYLNITWKDQFLIWHGKNSSHIENVRLPLNSIWYPQLTLLEVRIFISNRERLERLERR